MQWAAAVALMPLLIFCCSVRSSDLQCFSMGGQVDNPKICSSPWEIWILSDIWLLGPIPVTPNGISIGGISIGSAVYAGHIRVTMQHRQTHRQTDHATCDIRCNRPYARTYDMWPKMSIMRFALMGRNGTGPPSRAAPWWVTLHMR